MRVNIADNGVNAGSMVTTVAVVLFLQTVDISQPPAEAIALAWGGLDAAFDVVFLFFSITMTALTSFTRFWPKPTISYKQVICIL